MRSLTIKGESPTPVPVPKLCLVVNLQLPAARVVWRYVLSKNETVKRCIMHVLLQKWFGFSENVLIKLVVGWCLLWFLHKVPLPLGFLAAWWAPLVCPFYILLGLYAMFIHLDQYGLIPWACSCRSCTGTVPDLSECYRNKMWWHCYNPLVNSAPTTDWVS